MPARPHLPATGHQSDLTGPMSPAPLSTFLAPFDGVFLRSLFCNIHSTVHAARENIVFMQGWLRLAARLSDSPGRPLRTLETFQHGSDIERLKAHLH